MSAEEKKSCILGLFHSLKDVYVEKEVVSMATKAGVSQGAILETLEKLIDDGEVIKKKIGGSNYIWSFPAAKDRAKQMKYDSMKESVASAIRSGKIGLARAYLQR